MATFNFTTGPATLPDVGELSYNGCVFSPLFETQVAGVFVKDAAGRATKEIEYTITADGFVTLPNELTDIEAVLATLEELLSAPAGELVYSGRSINIEVNTNANNRDTGWGPVPEILEIVPLGSGGSAKIKWTVKTRIPPRIPKSTSALGPVLQFSYDTTVSYDEAGYSQLHLTGIVEIPLTRRDAKDRLVRQSADDFRATYPGALLATIDLSRFRIIRRDFKVSKDKKTLEFDVTAEELPWMALPPEITVARGQFTFRPAKAGVGLCNWLCTLTCTYTVPKTKPRRLAWLAFLALLRARMKAGNQFAIVPPPNGNQNPGAVANVLRNVGFVAPQGGGLALFGRLFRRDAVAALQNTRSVWLLDFNGSEGLYLDSKTVTFSATWRLITVFSEILGASGLWRKVTELDENVWAASVSDISGYQSWMRNKVKGDVIVDFGS